MRAAQHPEGQGRGLEQGFYFITCWQGVAPRPSQVLEQTHGMAWHRTLPTGSQAGCGGDCSNWEQGVGTGEMLAG